MTKKRSENEQAAGIGFYEEFDNRKISASPFQNRHFPQGWEQEKETQEFIANIMALGVVQPLVARPHPKKAGWLELVAGERRLRASQLAGRDSVPVIVRALSDSEAADIVISENLQRKDLSPLETARGIKTLVEVCGNDIDAIAEHCGKSRRWVYLALGVNNLAECWRKEAAPGGDLENWTLGHWAMISRFSEEEQREFYENQPYNLRESMPVCDLDKCLTDHFRLIRQALWRPEDDTLVPEVGACTECAQRTDRQRGLFDEDGASEEEIQSNARCMSRACWDRKTEAHREVLVASCRQKYPNLVYCATEYTHSRALESAKAYTPFYQSHDFDNAKKTDKGALPALVLFGKGVGKIRWIVPCGGRGSGATTRKTDPATGKPAEPSMEERLEKLENRRRAWIVDRMLALITHSGEGEIVPPHEVVMRYACAFTTRHFSQHEERFGWEDLKDPSAENFGKVDLNRYLWRSLHDDMLSALKFRRHLAYAEAEALARDCGIDFAELVKQAEEEIRPSKALLKQMEAA